MSLINVSHLTFSYEGSYENIFEDVSFQIDTDWKLGFTGRNGRGKTTFLKLLMGIYEYQGVISTSVAFDYFPFEVPDKRVNTLDIVERVNPDYIYWELQKEIYKLGMDDEVLYRPFNTLSNGEQTKVLLAVLFLKDNHFLLIDEPTNHLDGESRELVSRYLNSKKGFILVSHDRMFLDHCIDHVLSINKTNIEIQKGNFSTWYANKQMQDHYELAENERLMKDIQKLSDSARNAGKWADKVESMKIGRKSRVYEQCIDTRAYIGEKSRRMQQRRKNLERRRNQAVEDKKALLKNLEEVDKLKITPAAHHSGRLAEFGNITVRYGEKQVCSAINFSIEQGERVFLQGRNGCGKTSLIKLLLGEAIEFDGRFYRSGGLNISYVSQDTSFLMGNLKEFARKMDIDESLFKAILRKLDFCRIQFEKDMEYFSEGQKKKVLIAGSLCQKAHIYVWDEPLNFIDIFSRIQIEEMILNSKPTMLVVEHDFSFVRETATKIIKL